MGHLGQVGLVSDVFVLPRMNLTSAFSQPKGQEKNSLESQMLQGGFSDWFKGSLCQLV